MAYQWLGMTWDCERPALELIPTILAFPHIQVRHFKPIARSSTGGFWSSSSAESLLFDLPMEVLERIMYYLSPHLSGFARVNSDCRYLARPFHARYVALSLLGREKSRDLSVFCELVRQLRHDTAELRITLGAPVATFIRYLRLSGCFDFDRTHHRPGVELYYAHSDLIHLIPLLVNLEVFSHDMPSYSTLLVTGQYLLTLMKSPAKHVTLGEVIFAIEEIDLLHFDLGFRWPLQTLTIFVSEDFTLDDLLRHVPEIIVSLCSETLVTLTLECPNAFELLSQGNSRFPKLQELYLDTSSRYDVGPRRLPRQPALTTVRSVETFIMDPMPKVKRYDTWICDEEGLALVLENLKANPQLQMLNFTMGSVEPFPVIEQDFSDSLQKLPHLEALRIEGNDFVRGFCSKEGLESMAAITTLKSLQLLAAVNLPDLQHCKSLEWFSIWYPRVLNTRTCYRLQQAQYDRIHLYRILFQVELLLSSLPLLRGCIIGNIPITIVNGRARPLLSEPGSHHDVSKLIDHVWGFEGQQLWHWD